MDNILWEKIQNLCDKLSNVTYENLSKIIRLESTQSATQARSLDDSNLNDIDYWMGGGTCFSMTWYLYQELLQLGLCPKLVMGHKRKEKNIHCALTLQIDDENFSEYLFDPGYLIFEPLLVPDFIFEKEKFYPLIPNSVRLVRNAKDVLELWTGGAFLDNGKLSSPMKLRFEYPLQGVSIEEFKQHWSESFYREMMNYPVLNRLDKELGIQYYFQKGNLITRSKEGSKMEYLPEDIRIKKLSEIFKLSPSLVENALEILKTKNISF